MTGGRFADGLVARCHALPTFPALRGRAIGEVPATPETKNAQGGNPGRSICPAALRSTENMATVSQAHPQRQMAAAQCALLRWYPRMPLRLIDAIRLHRPGYPLIVGGLARRAHAAVAAFREYPGTLKNLELPGWQLWAGDAAFSLSAVREAAAQGRAA